MMTAMLIHLTAAAMVLSPSVHGIQAGMRGYGLTVFRGTRPEKFSVEVVGVLPKALLGQDLIVIRCDDPKLKVSGVVAGMSGSPIFVGGRFIGGLGYGFSFDKKGYALVTPAEAMKKLLSQSGQPSDPWGQNVTITPFADPRKLKFASFKTGTALPLSIPLLSTLPGEMTVRIFPFLEKYADSIVPTGMGAGSDTGTPADSHLHPGDAIGLLLVDGDIRLGGIGTVTYTKGNRAVIFAHPGLGFGTNPVVATRAHILTFISRYSSSFKLGYLTTPVGSQINEGVAGVVVDTKVRTSMIPVDISFNSPSVRKNFHFTIIPSRTMSMLLIEGLMNFVLLKMLNDAYDLTVELDYSFSVGTPQGERKWRFKDVFSAASIRNLFWMQRPRGLRALKTLLSNPFLRFAIRRVNIGIRIVPGRLSSYKINRIVAPAPVLKGGRTYTFTLMVSPPVGEERAIPVTITLPKMEGTQKLTIVVTGGISGSLPVPPPKNIAQLERYIAKYLSPDLLMVSFKVPEPAISLEGQRLERLPIFTTALLTPLSRGQQKLRSSRLYSAIHTGIPVSGKAKLTVVVEDE